MPQYEAHYPDGCIQSVSYTHLDVYKRQAKNKWLIGHPEGGLPDGSYIGLTGENLEIK